MRDKYPGFYGPLEVNFEELWNAGTFILDANVLLNLYRYTSEARDQLIDLFINLKDRMWLPYHSGLEYQRNRVSVIAEQMKRFSDIKKAGHDIVSTAERKINDMNPKDRHGLIDQTEFTENLRAAFDKFTTNLDNLEKLQIRINGDDPIRDKLDEIFEGRIGEPLDPKEINILSKGWEKRRAEGRPPGLRDEVKQKDTEPLFYYAGQAYQKNIGDLIVWEQIKAYAKNKELQNIIFLTDDNKDDWWWTCDSMGRKRLGPRPELVEEIRREASVKNFYMYGSYQFMENAKKMLEAPVEKAAIDQVRDISTRKSDEVIQPRGRDSALIRALEKWLEERHPDSVIQCQVAPAFVVIDKSGSETHYDFIKMSGFKEVLNSRLANILQEANNKYTPTNKFFYQIVVGDDDGVGDDICVRIATNNIGRKISNVGLILGGLINESNEAIQCKFIPRIIFE